MATMSTFSMGGMPPMGMPATDSVEVLEVPNNTVGLSECDAHAVPFTHMCV
jgi:hypothetical protein